MNLYDFDYYLPEELIAQFPVEKRDASRLMVLDRKHGTVEHRRFSDLPEYLHSGDVLILNNTKVIPARLFGKKATGGAVEVLLLEQSTEAGKNVWICLISPARRIRPGSEFFFEHGLKCRVIDRNAGDGWLMEFNTGNVDEIAEQIGAMPLPPYIKRGRGADPAAVADMTRYQTIFAKEKGAIAAPTAGLHFTDELLQRIRDYGVEVLYITLHTSIGTFKPVKEHDITRHRMMPEYYSAPPETYEAVKKARHEKRRIIAVGSTLARTLEVIMNNNGRNLSGATDIFIYPGYEFKAIDVLLTNFHLPKSTLIMLVSAFAGRDFILEAYRCAVKEKYRFFSYGDAMLIA